MNDEKNIVIENSTKKMPFLDHLDELRSVIFRCMLSLIIGSCIVGGFFPFFADILNYPLTVALAGNTEALQGLVTHSPMGIFSVLIQICFLGGLAISLPVMIYFIARFLAPGLTEEEKRVLFPSCLAVLGLFLVGALFSYFFIIPASLAVSISLNQTFGFQLIWSAPIYYGMIVWMTLGIGLCFEFPLALLLLIYAGTVTANKLKQLRRHMIVVILLVAALITPTSDPVSLCILALPLYGLYEAAILVGSKLEKKKGLATSSDTEEIEWPL